MPISVIVLDKQTGGYKDSYGVSLEFDSPRFVELFERFLGYKYPGEFLSIYHGEILLTSDNWGPIIVDKIYNHGRDKILLVTSRPYEKLESELPPHSILEIDILPREKTHSRIQDFPVPIINRSDIL